MNWTLLMESSTKALDCLGRSPVESWEDIHRHLDGLVGITTRPLLDLSEDCDSIGFVTFEYGVDGVSLEIAKYASAPGGPLRAARSPPHDSLHRGRLHAVGRLRAGVPVAPPNAAGGQRMEEVEVGQVVRRALPQGSAGGQRALERGRCRDLAAGEGARGSSRPLSRGPEDQLDHPGERELEPGESGLCSRYRAGHGAHRRGGRELEPRLLLGVGNASGRARAVGGAAGAARPLLPQPPQTRASFGCCSGSVPWNGPRWMQLVINSHQAKTLVNECGFDATRVLELGTFVEDSYFEPSAPRRRAECRRQLARILGGGEEESRVRPVEEFRAGVSVWMDDQSPVVCGLEEGLSLDPSSSSAIWLLQPTRVVPRKRIERDWDLIGALFRYPPFRTMFEENEEQTLTLHVTGPIPVEHEEDLVRVLDAYRGVLSELPPSLARRVFQVFTAGEGRSNAAPGERTTASHRVGPVRALRSRPAAEPDRRARPPDPGIGGRRVCRSCAAGTSRTVFSERSWGNRSSRRNRFCTRCSRRGASKRVSYRRSPISCFCRSGPVSAAGTTDGRSPPGTVCATLRSHSKPR